MSEPWSRPMAGLEPWTKVDCNYLREKIVGLETVDAVKKLSKSELFYPANAIVVRNLDKTGCIKYTLYAAEQVLPICSKAYSKNKSLKLAIEEVKTYLDNPSATDYENRLKIRDGVYDVVDSALSNFHFDTSNKLNN